MTAADSPVGMRADLEPLAEIVPRVERVLGAFLAERREALEALAPRGGEPVAEIERLVAAGGKRLRPACCYWGYRAAGGEDGEPIVRASAALELLHTMALIHDDLMDDADSRRGVPSSVRALATSALALEKGSSPGTSDPERFGRSAAILAGDLAAVLADLLFLRSGFDAASIARALAPYHAMREQMAAGQYLSLLGEGDPVVAARLKGGAYTFQGPLLIGAALAGADDSTTRALLEVGEPLGEAFQLRDDLRDADAPHDKSAADVDALVDLALHAIDAIPAGGSPNARVALRALAETVRP